MKIIFVMVLSCAGKSTFIKKNFSDMKVLDLFEYEERIGFSIPAIKEAYKQIEKDLVDCVKNNEDIIMEHTLLKAIRREVYIKAIKEVSDSPIIGYFLLPSDDEIKANAKKRRVKMSDSELKNVREILDIPSVEEGFSEIHIVDKNLYKN